MRRKSNIRKYLYEITMTVDISLVALSFAHDEIQCATMSDTEGLWTIIG